MWAAVTDRFLQFHQNIAMTASQVSDGFAKCRGVVSCLNSWYYELDSASANSLVIGSWGKQTCVRPPRDIDILFELPFAVFERFNLYSGNRQSSLLQEVKTVLQKRYPTTEMRGDGQVIVVRFSSVDVEIVPAFKFTTGQYWICDTNNGGSYKATDPIAEDIHVASIHQANNSNLRPIVMMLKTWQRVCNVPLKSFYLELVASDFLQTCEWRLNGYYYYDWIVRDFFQYLYSRKGLFAVAPGTHEVINLGDAWESRCRSAIETSLRACDHERSDYMILAGEEWQKIFGMDIPRSLL